MKIKVLIVDDHGVVRDGLRAMLEDEVDISVVGDASNGLDAVEKTKKVAPDVVLMDISMPEMDGIEATKKVMEICPQARVIILSIFSTAEQVYQSLKAGARGYLLKESVGREVVEAVRAVAAGKKYFSQPVTTTLVNSYLKNHEQLSYKSPLETLSQREFEVLKLVLAGKSSAEIAGQLNLSPKTVQTYRSRMMEKLGVADYGELIRFAIHNGLISS